MAIPQRLIPVDSSKSNNSKKYEKNLYRGIFAKNWSRQGLGIGQATKPLPRLPRGWSRACHETGFFLRKIGLGIIVTAFQGFFTKDFREPEKIAVHQNRFTALLGTLIHAIPLGMAIFEIFLNWKGHYVGGSFDKQNYLQFVAKTHEILMQTSLATIILSYVRYQISAGKGMPFGTILCTLQSLQISYLWSVEFWSAILSQKFQLTKKIHFAVLTFICITIATTAGPSSANLLIARQGIWPAKSLYLAINATLQDIWPDRLDGEDIPNYCKMMRYSSQDYPPDCPLASMAGFLQGGPSLGRMDVFQSGDMDIMGVIANKDDVSSDMIISPCSGFSKYQTCSTNAQKIFLAGLTQDSQAQIEFENTDHILEAYHSVKENYFQPYTVASCVTDIVQDSSDQTPLRFARLSETSAEHKNVRKTVSVPSLKKGQFTSDIPGKNDQFRVGWADLPQDVFSTGIPGAIFVHPQTSSDLDSSYNITTCTLNAGWGSSMITTDTIRRKYIQSHVSKLPDAWPIQKASMDAYGLQFITAPDFWKQSNFLYPQRRVSVSQSWMESLNLNVILDHNSTTSLMNLLLSRRSAPPGEHEIAFMLSFLLTPALSATGWKHDTKGICNWNLE